MLHGGDVNDSTVLMFPPLICMSTIILLTYIQFSVIYVCSSFDFIVLSATFSNISAIS